MSLIFIVILVFAILLVIFTLQNSFQISIDFFLWKLDNVPFVLVLISSIVLGYFLASIYFYPRLWTKGKEIKRLQKANKKLEELHKAEIAANSETDTEEKNPEGIELDDDKGSSFFED